MTNALAVRNVTLSDWQIIQAVAPTMHQARLFGVSSADQAAAIMLKGYELGLGLAASFELIHVIQGKPALSPRGALALIHRSGELADMKVTEATTPPSCTVWMKRRSGFEHTITFTLEDARRAGVIKPDSAWSSYPANMLRWRAIGFCADVVFPDVLGGLKRADELGADVNEAGDVIEGQAVAPDPRYIPEVSGAGISLTPAVSLESLVSLFGADAVMQAAGGRIPGDEAEVAAVAAVLTAVSA